MKNSISKVVNLDKLELEDLIIKHNLDDFEYIMSINQEITDAIIFLSKESQLEVLLAITAISKTSSLLQDLNRIEWSKYLSKKDK